MPSGAEGWVGALGRHGQSCRPSASGLGQGSILVQDMLYPSLGIAGWYDKRGKSCWRCRGQRPFGSPPFRDNIRLWLWTPLSVDIMLFVLSFDGVRSVFTAGFVAGFNSFDRQKQECFVLLHTSLFLGD